MAAFEITEKTHSHGCFGGDRGSVLDLTKFLKCGLMCWCVLCVRFVPRFPFWCREELLGVRTCPKGSVLLPLRGVSVHVSPAPQIVLHHAVAVEEVSSYSFENVILFGSKWYKINSLPRPRAHPPNPKESHDIGVNKSKKLSPRPSMRKAWA